MAESIGDALRRYADEQEHAEYQRRVLEAGERFRGQALTQHLIERAQVEFDRIHMDCSIMAGRRLRRITIQIKPDDHNAVLLIIEPYQPAAYGNDGE